MLEARNNVTRTSKIRRPTYYVAALNGEFAHLAYDEARAEGNKGQWREKIFKCSPETPLDVEIGTGNGFFFTHQAVHHPERMLLGIELKFKPLIQAVRRAERAGAKNARIARYNALFLKDLVAENEIDNVYIHHPDPWNTVRRHKRRIVTSDYLNQIYGLQKPGSLLEFKSDSGDYFEQVLEEIAKTPYQINFQTRDLHQSEISGTKFITHFESLFIRKGQPIHYLLAQK